MLSDMVIRFIYFLKASFLRVWISLNFTLPVIVVVKNLSCELQRGTDTKTSVFEECAYCLERFYNTYSPRVM